MAQHKNPSSKSDGSLRDEIRRLVEQLYDAHDFNDVVENIMCAIEKYVKKQTAERQNEKRAGIRELPL